MNNRLLVIFVLMFSLVLNLRAQQQSQQPSPSPPAEPKVVATPEQSSRDDDPEVVRITANLVQIDAVVTKDGKHVTDLKQEDFEILEDGKPQLITQFSYVSNIPEANLADSATSPRPIAPKDAPNIPVKLRPTDTRRTLALVVDDLGISAQTVPILKRQLRKFLDNQLQPNDLVSILFTGGREAGALQQFTTDRRLLNSAVEQLRWNPCSRAGTRVFDGHISLCALSRDTLDRSLEVLRFALRGLRDLPGRKSMVVFSDSLPSETPAVRLPQFEGVPGQASESAGPLRDGADPGIGDQANQASAASSTIAALHRVAELAIRASVVIYAVDTRGLQPNSWQAIDEQPRGSLQSRIRQSSAVLTSRSDFLVEGREGGKLMARETGGFAVFNSNDFGLQRVLDDQRGYYLIGYRPKDETFNRRFHNIKVNVRGSGLEVRTRKGFYGVTDVDAKATELSARDRMSMALMSPFGANDVHVRLTTIYINDPAKGPLLRSLLFLNARDLVFKHLPEGTHEASFDLCSVIFGHAGIVIILQDDKVTLRLRQERYDQVQREGVVYKFDRPVGQVGAFQFRLALHDPVSSRIGAAGQFIEVPNLRNGRLAISGILVGGAGEIENHVRSGPAVRQFPQGSTLNFVYLVYNAAPDPNTRLPQLTVQTRIFRDSNLVHTGQTSTIELNGQTDLARIAAADQLQLGSTLPPGDYVLQIIVNDHMAREKERSVTQWIDFAIVK